MSWMTVIHYKTNMLPCWYELPVFASLKTLVPEMTLFSLMPFGLQLAF